MVSGGNSGWEGSFVQNNEKQFGEKGKRGREQEEKNRSIADFEFF
jgi:hypothetical protein